MLIQNTLAKLGIVALAGSVTIVPVILSRSFNAPPELINKEEQKRDCFVIPAKASNEDTKLLVCLRGDEEEYYLFDSRAGEDPFLKIESLQWHQEKKQITVRLEVEGENIDSFADILNKTFDVIGNEWNNFSQEVTNLSEICTLPRYIEPEKSNETYLWVCGKDLATISLEKMKGIPLTPFKEYKKVEIL